MLLAAGWKQATPPLEHRLSLGLARPCSCRPRLAGRRNYTSHSAPKTECWCSFAANLQPQRTARRSLLQHGRCLAFISALLVFLLPTPPPRPPEGSSARHSRRDPPQTLLHSVRQVRRSVLDHCDGASSAWHTQEADASWSRAPLRRHSRGTFASPRRP